MTSFGKTVLRYMVSLKPALEDMGFEVAVFHATGMGGRAFESLAAEGAFAAVMDFAPQELTNHIMGSAISAGPDRMTNAGRAGIPQIIAPGCYDLVDVVGWQPLPERFKGYEVHAHNRLLSSILLGAEERREVAQAICKQLSEARAPVTLILPTQGCNEWDREGAPLHDADGMAAFASALRAACPPNVTLLDLDAHINDAGFSELALAVLQVWIDKGIVKRP